MYPAFAYSSVYVMALQREKKKHRLVCRNQTPFSPTECISLAKTEGKNTSYGSEIFSPANIIKGLFLKGFK